MTKRLGIYGGTFDPIHMGHLVVAELSRQECDLDSVLFIPASNPPHKKDRSVSPQEHRFEMIRLAIEGNHNFEISDMELKRQGISYTVDTLKALRGIYSLEYEIWMIIGGDTLLELDTWKNSGEIIKMVNFAVYMRPNFPMDRCEAKAKALSSQGRTQIEFVQGPMIDISSTEIRQRVAKGKSIRYMVPDSVRKYILDRELFRF